MVRFVKYVQREFLGRERDVGLPPPACNVKLSDPPPLLHGVVYTRGPPFRFHYGPRPPLVVMNGLVGYW